MLETISKLLTVILICSMCGCHYTKKLGLVPLWTPKNTKPKNYQDLIEKGFSCLEENKLDSAESYFLGALECDPDSEVILNNLGLIYFEQEKFYLAATSFQKALEVTEEPAIHHNNLGQVWEAAKKFEKAETEYRQAIEMDPQTIEFKSHLARVLRRRSRTDFETESLLVEVSRYDDRPEWRDWANLEIQKIREQNTRNSENEFVKPDRTEIAPSRLNERDFSALHPRNSVLRKDTQSQKFDNGIRSNTEKAASSKLSPLLPIPSETSKN